MRVWAAYTEAPLVSPVEGPGKKRARAKRDKTNTNRRIPRVPFKLLPLPYSVQHLDHRTWLAPINDKYDNRLSLRTSLNPSITTRDRNRREIRGLNSLIIAILLHTVLHYCEPSWTFSRYRATIRRNFSNSTVFLTLIKNNSSLILFTISRPNVLGNSRLDK